VVLAAARQAADRVALSVTDSGPGIAADQLARIFEKFHQVGGPNRQGTGLGLAISRAIVEQHGGTLEVESTLGAGTTFTVSLPAGGAPSSR
jgi:signal transduction histidine kinase